MKKKLIFISISLCLNLINFKEPFDLVLFEHNITILIILRFEQNVNISSNNINEDPIGSDHSSIF